MSARKGVGASPAKSGGGTPPREEVKKSQDLRAPVAGRGGRAATGRWAGSGN